MFDETSAELNLKRVLNALITYNYAIELYYIFILNMIVANVRSDNTNNAALIDASKTNRIVQWLT